MTFLSFARNVTKDERLVTNVAVSTDVRSGLRKQSMATVMTPVASREVLRCDHCGLVQFSTSNLLCRRCHKPLEVLEPESVASTGDAAATRPTCERTTRVSVRLRELRNARRLSQRQLAARLDVPRTYISKIENGRAMPTLSSLQRLADALSVPLADMVYDARYERERELAIMLKDPFLAELSVWVAGLDGLHRAMVLSHLREMAGGGRKTA